MKTYEVLKAVRISGKTYAKGDRFTADLPAVGEQEGLYRKLYTVVDISPAPVEIAQPEPSVAEKKGKKK